MFLRDLLNFYFWTVLPIGFSKNFFFYETSVNYRNLKQSLKFFDHRPRLKVSIQSVWFNAKLATSNLLTVTTKCQ